VLVPALRALCGVQFERLRGAGRLPGIECDEGGPPR
jgi:hypothetical protein